jgi:hypothetical protein
MRKAVHRNKKKKKKDAPIIIVMRRSINIIMFPATLDKEICSVTILKKRENHSRFIGEGGGDELLD